MWVARNKDGALILFKDKPIRVMNKEWNYDMNSSRSWRPLWFGFEEVTWETEPLEIPDDYFNIKLW